jgi:hypothetical protein
MMVEDEEGELAPSHPSNGRLSSSNKRRGGITGIEDDEGLENGEVSLNLEEGTDDRGMGDMEYDQEMDDDAIRLASQVMDLEDSNSEGVDQEIEQIVSKNQGSSSNRF